MSLLLLKRLLQFLCLATIVSTAVVAWWGFGDEIPMPEGLSQERDQVEVTRTSVQMLDQPDAEAFNGLLKKRRQQPLYDAKRQAPVVVTKPKLPPNVGVVGIMLEPGNSIAMLQPTGKEVEIRKVGDEIDDGKGLLEIVAIEASHVVFKRGEESFTVPMSTEHTQ